MNNLLTVLVQHFEQESKREKSIVQPGNKHVFDACMEILEPTLDFEEKMTLMDYHLCYNNALDGARQGNLDSSTFWLNKAEELPTFEKPILKKLLDVNKIPAIAYHLYKEGDYDKAIEMLIETIEISGALGREGNIDYMVWGQMEDYINIFRALCTKKDQAGAITYAQAILLAGAVGKHTTDVVENVSSELLLKAEIPFLSYATGDILMRLLKFENLDRAAIVKAVFQPLWDLEDWTNCPLKGYEEAVFALKYWTEGDTKAFAAAIEKLLPNLAQQSNILQFYILEALLPSITTCENTELKESLKKYISDYYINNLELSQFILLHHSKLNFELVAI